MNFAPSYLIVIVYFPPDMVRAQNRDGDMRDWRRAQNQQLIERKLDAGFLQVFMLEPYSRTSIAYLDSLVMLQLCSRASITYLDFSRSYGFVPSPILPAPTFSLLIVVSQTLHEIGNQEVELLVEALAEEKIRADLSWNSKWSCNSFSLLRLMRISGVYDGYEASNENKPKVGQCTFPSFLVVILFDATVIDYVL